MWVLICVVCVCMVRGRCVCVVICVVVVVAAAVVVVVVVFFVLRDFDDHGSSILPLRIYAPDSEGEGTDSAKDGSVHRESARTTHIVLVHAHILQTHVPGRASSTR